MISTLPGQQVAVAARGPDRHASQGHRPPGRARRGPSRRREREPAGGGGRLMESASIAAATPTPTSTTARRRPTTARGSTAAARDPALHRLRGDALRGVLHLVLLPPGRAERRRGRRTPFELPVAVAGVNTAILRLLELHDALGAGLDQARQPPRACRSGLVTTFLLGATFLFIQINEYVHIGFAPATAPSARSSTASPACTAPTSSSA